MHRETELKNKHATNTADYESNVRYYSKHFKDIFTHALGSYIFNKDGRCFIDFFCGAGALNYGHNNPAFKQALIDYIQSEGIIHGLDMHTPPHLQFLDDFHDIILKNRSLDFKIQFTGPTGANAVEAALKLARKVTGRKNIAYFKGAYHGLSLGALSVTESDQRRDNLPLNFSDTFMLPFDSPGNTEIVCKQITEKIEKLSTEELPAAFILETTQGEGGVNVASHDWIRFLVEIGNRYGILLIVDDIQVGCGRTGTFFSFEKLNIYPDMVCLSKSISGYGLPLSLVLIKPSLDIWYSGEHNGTFRSNNLSLVSACIALNFWKTDEFERNTQKKSEILRSYLDAVNKKYSDHHGKVKGIGLIQGIEWPDHNIAPAIAETAFQEGLIIETAGKFSQVLKFLPALTISEEVMQDGFNILDHAIQKVLR